MRHTAAAAALLFLALAAACYDQPAGPGGPVTLKFTTPSYPGVGGATVVARGTLVMDGRDSVTIPDDSLVGVARGYHEVSAWLDVAYAPTHLSGTVDPAGSVMLVDVPLPAGCRLYQYDAWFCVGRSAVRWAAHARTYCPAGDFGEFCTWYVDGYGLGLSWPADSADNQYVAHAKLLVAATMGSGAPPAVMGDTLAMALFRAGDYSPWRRLAVVGGDSARWQSEAWTDVRRVPVSRGTPAPLNVDDRVGDTFGLGVRTTIYQPAAAPNALFVRFDVRNVSADPDFRRVHPEEPAGGHALANIYLAPLLDPAIACNSSTGCTAGEERDDNATVFPAESLLVAYDQEFLVPEFRGGYASKPGLVGLRLIDGPPGTSAKGVIFDAGTTPDFLTATLERATYRLLSGGRAGAVAGCADYDPAALVCAPETRSDIRMGWSVGPIAALAPGDSTHLVVAILFAPPAPGTFTSGTGVAPGNVSAQSLADTTRSIYRIGAPLRALGDSVKGTVVDGTAP